MGGTACDIKKLLPLLAAAALAPQLPQLTRSEWDVIIQDSIAAPQPAPLHIASCTMTGEPAKAGLKGSACAAPRMSVGRNPWPWKGHRSRCPFPSASIPAMVARPVQGKEKRENIDAMKALKKEWDRLRAIKTWDEDNPEEYWTVLKRLRGQGKHGNFARIFDICVEKNSELNADDIRRKYKGRVVYGGHRVWDEW